MEEGTVGYDDSFHRRKDYRFYEDDYDEDDSLDDYDGDDGEEWHDLDEVLEFEQRVKVLVGLDGRPALRDVQFDQERVLKSEECFDEADEQEDYEGYMGNSVGKTCAWQHPTKANCGLRVPRRCIGTASRQVLPRFPS